MRDDVETPNGEEPVRLLDAWPDLGDGLTAEESAAARRHLVVGSLRVPPGTWSPAASEAIGATACILILDGLLVRETIMGDVRAPELLAGGDVVHVGADGASGDLVGATVAWTAVGDAHVATLQAATLARIASWPSLYSALIGRATERSTRQSVHQAICNHVRVDARILGVLWHMSERWGRVTPGGVVLPLQLTHDALATIVGAQRPTVTTALKSLSERGLVRRREDGAWIVRPDTSEQLERLFARGHAGRAPDAHLLDDEQREAREYGDLQDQIERVQFAWEQQAATVMGLRERTSVLRERSEELRREMARLRQDRLRSAAARD